MSIVRHLNRYLFGYNKIVTNCPKRVELLSNRIRYNAVWKMSSFQFSSAEELKVEHNPKKHQFFVQMGRDKAVLEYRTVSPGVLDLYHTEVPVVFRGKGIAKLLAKESFDYIVSNKLQMIVSCTYLQKYLADNQKEEYLKVLHQTQD